jgi:transposase
VREQIREIEQARLERLERASGERHNTMVRLLARVIGVGVETADLLVNEILSRNLRDRRAVARYAGLTGAAGRERGQAPGEGLGEGGQCSRSSQHAPARLAISAVPGRQ